MPRWWERSETNAVPTVPWMGPDVVSYLESIVQPDWKVAEHGSGGSTVWFSERVAKVVSVEGDGDWYASLEAVLPDNVELISPKKPGPSKKIQCGKFDLLLIDGMPLEDRALWLDAAERIVKPGGVVILDNCNREEYADARARMQARSAEVILFDENSESAGTKYLMTEFYVLPGAPEPVYAGLDLYPPLKGAEGEPGQGEGDADAG